MVVLFIVNKYVLLQKEQKNWFKLTIKVFTEGLVKTSACRNLTGGDITTNIFKKSKLYSGGNKM